MKSFTGKFTSARGWVLMIALLLGAGLMISACGDEEVPAPTTPAPPPPPPEPEPEPEPEPPATPTGLMSRSTATSITWTWNAVEGAAGYVVQANTDEMWDDTDTVTFTVGGATVPFTTETTYTASDLETGTTMYVRVAAAAGTPDAFVTSAFSTHVTGTAEAPPPDRPPAPVNVRLKEAGPTFIVWEWDPVAVADGYQSQFSADGSSFGSQVSHEGMGSTTRRVSNLSPETAGYLRVRSYTGSGTGTDTLTSEDWSDSNRQETGEAPPPEPLDAPENVETDIEDDSITLTWDQVDDAETYEVEFREEGASDWDDANCGNGSNVVTEEECVATGLEAGTDYEFRVRGVPVDDDDDAHLVGDWSEIEDTRTAGTATPDPTEQTSGGMGDLNIEWETTETGITFLWDRVADAEYETFVLETYSDDPEPCEGVTFTARGRSTSEPVSVDRGMVRGLCVQTTDEDDRRLSFAWGASTPVAPTAGGPTVEDGKTTSLPWTGINVMQDFNHFVRLVADSGREDGMFSSTTAPTNAALQNACAGGMRLDDGLADVTLTGLTETVDRGIRHFTGYTLCLQYSNDAGATHWAVPVNGDGNLNEIHTTPAMPPAPRFDRGTNNAAGDERTLAWTVPVRNSTDVPREADGFEVLIIHYPARYDHDGDGGTTALVTTPAPTTTTCGDDTDTPSNLVDGGTNPWDRTTTSTTGTSLDGVTVTAAAIDIPANTEQNLSVRLCVRATRSSAGGTAEVNGPWRIGGATTITKQAPPF